MSVPSSNPSTADVIAVTTTTTSQSTTSPSSLSSSPPFKQSVEISASSSSSDFSYRMPPPALPCDGGCSCLCARNISYSINTSSPFCLFPTNSSAATLFRRKCNIVRCCETQELQQHSKQQLPHHVATPSSAVRRRLCGCSHQHNILSDVDVIVRPGQLVAIMGPSGSGKTTLLNAISGRLPIGESGDVSCCCFGCFSTTQRLLGNVCPTTTTTSKKTSAAKATGHIYLEGNKCTTRQLQSACSYVMQNDHLVDILTVEETLTMRAALRHPQKNKNERKQLVEDVMRQLDIDSLRNFKVGGGNENSRRDGLSGGEVRRVSIAVAVIDKHQLLVLDEPTTGLDSSLAYDVTVMLSKLAKGGEDPGGGYERQRRCRSGGMGIVMSVHQPSSRMMDMFDWLLLLHDNGRVAYQGRPSGVLSHFSSLGYLCPKQINTADFVMDLLGGDRAVRRAQQHQGTVTDEKQHTGRLVVDSAGLKGARPIRGGVVVITNDGGDCCINDNDVVGERVLFSEQETQLLPGAFRESDLATKLNDLLEIHSGGGRGKQQHTSTTATTCVPKDGEIPAGREAVCCCSDVEAEGLTQSGDVVAAAGTGGLGVSNSCSIRSRLSRWLNEFRWLCWRSSMQWWRQPVSRFSSEILVQLLLGLVVGASWFHMRGGEGRTGDLVGLFFTGGISGTKGEVLKQTSDVKDSVGLIFFISLLLSFLSFSTMITTTADRMLFNREVISGHLYSPSSFFVGKCLAETIPQHLPVCFFIIPLYFMSGLSMISQRQFIIFFLICHLTMFAAQSYAYFLAAALPSIRMVFLVAPLSLVLMTLFCGFLVNLEAMPSWVRWVQWVSFLKYSFSSMLLNQMPPSDTWGVMKASEWLTAMGLPPGQQDIYTHVGLLFAWGWIVRFAAFVALKCCNRSKGLEV
eukprot:GHVS01083924.1.p1 GENE.GHVS01083924.1~~GHVS01083924.1.p1  ORF type:complete len:910 (+),score=146.90 GHVS01083924.1:167-2896(+)